MEKKPAVRFKGFADEWEQRKLGDISDFITKGATPTTYGFDWVEKGIPFFRNDSIKDNIFVYGDYSYISDEANEVLNRSEITAEDILVAITGDIGKVGIVPNSIIKGNINQHMARVRILDEAVPYFVYQYMATEKLQQKYHREKTGLSMPQLSLEQIRNTDIELPSYEEQDKIANYLLNLDNLIALYQRKCDNLKEVKKYMLQKMFPKNGEKVPEIRFAGFTGDWERRKLSALCEKITVGIANSATHAYTEDGIVMFRNQNIKENYLDDSDVIHIDDEFEQKYVNKRLRKNDLLVTRTGYPGTACVVPAKYEGAQTFTTLIARLNEGTNPYYVCQYINSDYGKKYFLSTQIGGGQKNSGAGILDEFPMILPPTIEEQNKIAGYLSNLDNLIALHQRKCDNLKEVKKYMLQNMFA